MGLIRVDPAFEKKIKNLHMKLQNEHPRKRITIVNITANLDIKEDDILKRIEMQEQHRRRGNRYFY